MVGVSSNHGGMSAGRIEDIAFPVVLGIDYDLIPYLRSIIHCDLYFSIRVNADFKNIFMFGKPGIHPAAVVADSDSTTRLITKRDWGLFFMFASQKEGDLLYQSLCKKRSQVFLTRAEYIDVITPSRAKV
jgi:hypothetical protein